MKTVTIVGAGALGSHLVLFARNWDVNLRVIDFDRVESKNMQSQFHTKLGHGKGKVLALQAAMMGLFHCRLNPFPVKLVENNSGQLLSDADLVIDCTDNFAARTVIKEAVEDIRDVHGTPECLHGCLSADGTLARVVWTEHFTADSEGGEGEATCEDGANLPFHAMAGALIANVAQRFLESGEKKSWQLTPSSLIRIA